MQDLILNRLGDARTLLAQAKDAISAKQVVDLAHAAEIYAKRQKLSQESIDYAHEIQIDALKLMGEYLKLAPKADGGDAQRTRFHKSTESPPTYASAGIDKKQAADAQFLADVAQTAPELYEQVKSGDASISEARREVNKRDKAQPPPMRGKYRVIYADPPWSYGNSGVIGETDNYGHVERHYPSMSIEELCALPVKDLAENDSVLFLWVTSPLLAECFPVITSWGFKYKTSFVWDKVKHNFGHYNSVRHEMLLICTRGSCTPDSDEKIDSVQTIERSEKHSEKPEEFRAIIDRLYPNGKRIELFSRKSADGWEGWGNEPA